MSIKKNYLKTKPVCKVTFRHPKKAAVSASSIYLVGDFNNWDKKQTPMKNLKNGDFTITVDLELNKEYQFRYYIDNKNWSNDYNADKYVPTVYGDSENSVVVI